jgi:hypothetical protein
MRPLDACEAKIARAGEHLDSVRSIWRAFLDGEPYGMPFTSDASKPHTIEVIALPFDDPPIALSIALGDFAHNARSALDHLVCRFVDPASLRDDLPNAFPIYTSREAFVQDLTPRVAKRARRALLRGIEPSSLQWQLIESVQPYQADHLASRHALLILAELSNRDKHRALNAAFAAPDWARFDASIKWDEDVAPVTVRHLVSPGEPIAVSTPLAEYVFDPMGPIPDMYVDGLLPLEPVFDYGVAVATLSDLEQIVALVSEVLGRGRTLVHDRQGA